MKASTLLFGLAISASAAEPGYYTGNKLLSDCESEKGERVMFCMAYVQAVLGGYQSAFIDGALNATAVIDAGTNEKRDDERLHRQQKVVLAVLSNNGEDIPFCPPPSMTIRQTADVAVKYLHETPERRHLDASWLIVDAFKAYFPSPCSSEKR